MPCAPPPTADAPDLAGDVTGRGSGGDVPELSSRHRDMARLKRRCPTSIFYVANPAISLSAIQRVAAAEITRLQRNPAGVGERFTPAVSARVSLPSEGAELFVRV